MAELVVVGFNRYATYFDLAMGAHLVTKGARFIGTNPDPSFPSEIAFCLAPAHYWLLSRQEPALNQPSLENLVPSSSVKLFAVCRAHRKHFQVGDRLTTDIAGAKGAGIGAILVLSGISTREDVETSQAKPDHIFADISN